METQGEGDGGLGSELDIRPVCLNSAAFCAATRTYNICHQRLDRDRLAKLKTLLRKAAARTVDHLWSVIAVCLNAFTRAKCANYFAAAGCILIEKAF